MYQSAKRQSDQRNNKLAKWNVKISRSPDSSKVQKSAINIVYFERTWYYYFLNFQNPSEFIEMIKPTGQIEVCMMKSKENMHI